MRNKLERLENIKNTVSNMQKVSVTFLSEKYNVSEQTIRSDLEELEDEGFLTRFHGGASYNAHKSSLYGTMISEADIVNNRQKEAIGSIAAEMINNRESIFLGPGSTIYYTALAMRERTDIRANIVTNNFYVACALKGCSNYRLQFIGGLCQLEGGYTDSEDLDYELNDHFFDKLFFSTDAADLVHGYTLSDPPAHNTIIKASGHAKQIVSLIDSSKYDRQSFFKIGDLDFAKTVITDNGIPERFKNRYKEIGVDLLITQ